MTHAGGDHKRSAEKNQAGRGDAPRTADTSPAPAARTDAGSLLRLQRLAGNAAVAGMVVQRLLKLKDGPSTAVGGVQQQLNALGATPRLGVTGRFDVATESAVKAFQAKHAGLKPPTGIVDDATQKKLDAMAPLVKRGGQQTVEVGGAEVRGIKPVTTEQVNLTVGAKGVAVRELQQRLNNSPTMAEAKRKGRATASKLLSVDGIFGPLTAAALAQFQADAALPGTGVADPPTWKQLLKVGAASQGRVEYEWREEVEGVKNVGGRAKYEWKLTRDQLRITAGIDFIPKAPAKMGHVSGRIHEWLNEIREIWGAFSAVNKKNPKDKVKVDFAAVRKQGEFKVNVHKTKGRSDAANWYITDRRRGLAAHEFGHLIGLADEYNRDEGQYLAATGQEVPVGKVTKMDDATADTIAKAIKAKMPLTDNGLALAQVVFANLKQSQGGDSRFVAERYFKLYSSRIADDIAGAFITKGITGFKPEKTWAITPFLYSNASIMGTMEQASAATVKAEGHDHSVEPRHIMPFINIIIRERSLESGTLQEYEPVRR